MSSLPSATSSSLRKKGDPVPPYGPKDAKIVIIGEAPGETEDQLGVPFCGNSGEELRKMLFEAGIKKSECYLTNVFKIRPPDNKLDAWCVNKEDLPDGYGLPPLFPRRFIAPWYGLARCELHEELDRLSPNLIIAAGGVACWALDIGSISQNRGVITKWGRHKVLPVYHPSAIFKQWQLRTITIGDLIKAKYESSFPEIRRPERELWIEPTLEEVQEFFRLHLDTATEVSLDIENPGGTLNCISFSPSANLSLCIPFVDHRKPDKSYWTFQEEVLIWRLIRHLLITRTIQGTIRTIGQNLLYDVQHLDRQADCRLACISDDTMLAHHAMFPEMQKGLGFLGSVYTNELSWKDMAKELWKDK